MIIMPVAKRVYIVAAIIIAVLVIGGVWYYQTTMRPAKVVKVGVLTPLSGAFAFWGGQISKAASLAAEEINAEGGVLGYKIELVIRDTKSDPSEAIAAFKELADLGVVAVMGPVSSSVGLALSGLAEEYKIPVLLDMAGSFRILKATSRYVFRTGHPANVMDAQACVMLLKEHNIKRVALIVADYEYGRSWAEAFEKAVKEGAPEIEYHIEIAPLGETDFTPYLRRIQGFNPEVLSVEPHPARGHIAIKQAIEMGLPIKYYLVTIAPITLQVEALGEAAIGGKVLIMWTVNFESEEYLDFAKRFYEKYGEFADGDAVLGYVALKRIAEAIKEAGSTDPQAIARAIRTGRYETNLFLYPLSYTEWGELKECRLAYVALYPGPFPEGLYPDINWHIRNFYVSGTIPPYVPPE